MFITALLVICAIMFIISMLHLTDTAYTKHDCKKYQEHIDDLVNELFPPSSIQDSTIQTPAIQAPTPNESHYQQEDTVQYQEVKRKMVADIKRYFNQSKMDSALRETENKIDLPTSSPVFSDGPVRPTPPSIGLWLE